jgi:adenylate cyclase
VAARLQTLAQPGQGVIGGATRDALGAAPGLVLTPLGDLDVKGRRQAVRAYSVVGVRG